LATSFATGEPPCSPRSFSFCSKPSEARASSNAGRHVGYNGVTVWTPDGKLIGRIRLPEVCANFCFGGPKRNRLFMAASQSFYAVYTATQGAGPG
jgi:gluconolactonase